MRICAVVKRLWPVRSLTYSTAMEHLPNAAEVGPWNPGIESSIPAKFQHLSSMFRPDNVATDLAEARELSSFTGIDEYELVRFRPERLVTHEVLIRVMTDLSVADGEDYGDLGINFRAMVSAILERTIAGHMPDLVKRHAALIEEAHDMARAMLDEATQQPRQAVSGGSQKPGLLARLGLARKMPPPAPAAGDGAERLEAAIGEWQRQAAAGGGLPVAVAQGLHTVVTSIVNTRGRLLGDPDMIAGMVATLVANEHGSSMLGEAIAPLFDEAVSALGYRRLPIQDHPIIMNVKGASAAGKSTLRPLQKLLARRIGVAWEDFALISPDIWRKFLLDYDGLGEASRYAGSLTGHEVGVIDAKLDRYMAAKGERKAISHLLIDRFRFDSFATNPNEEGGGRLLTRFGDLVYMFFLITPPEETVERAWKRGRAFGRYKAVDDLLDHNVEAYTGMPQLYFTWALRQGKQVHCEFLDNSVPLGQSPRTVAFGWNGELNILDVERMIAVDRYRRININAMSRAEVYPDDGAFAAAHNVKFLRNCTEVIPVVNFADQETGTVYARLEGGQVAMLDPAGFRKACRDGDAKAGLAAVLPEEDAVRAIGKPLTLDRVQSHTLGAWGRSAKPSQAN